MPRLRFFFAVCLLLVLTVSSRADVVISEFLANNDTSIVDEDGDHSDWIELFNDGATPVNLGGWHLTDNSGNPTKWAIPAVTLEPKGFLVIFASGKDRTNPSGVLHTNFRLGAEGGYLALFRPNGSASTEFNPYPAQYPDKPYGIQHTVSTTTFLPGNAPLRYRVPVDNSLGLTWTTPAFDDTSWNTGTNGVGFDAAVAGWRFKTVFAKTSVGSIAEAENVLANPNLQGQVEVVTHPVINYNNSDAPGNYPLENPPPALTSPRDWFVVEATGTITIPASGLWTFCVTSDDGCSLQVRPIGGTYTTLLTAPARGMSNSLATYQFTSAGDYEIRVVIFENGGGAGGEVSAMQGPAGSWSSQFRLIGDTANGGLAVKSLPADSGPSFSPFIGTNLASAMYTASPKRSSVFLRFPFNILDPGAVTSLSMPIKYDDGFVAYLNGVEVARRNVPAGMLNFDSTASASRENTAVLADETIDLTPYLGQIVAGQNVLAIHALNAAPDDGDLLLRPLIQQSAVTPGTFNYYTSATPGTFNTEPVFNKVAPVIASVERGFYTSPQSVALSTGTPGATIRYTFDGSTPTETSPSSAVYSAPISINKTTTLRYRAFKAGAEPSETVTQTYIFLSDVLTQSPTGAAPVVQNPPGAPQSQTVWPTGPVKSHVLDYGMDPDIVNHPTYGSNLVNDLKSIPTLSLVTDLPNLFDPGEGIYVNQNESGRNWERPASLELIHPDGSTEGFQANCGIRIRGGFSRSSSNPKHSFRVFFRSEYGPGKLSYPLFGDDPTGATEFDKFDIRTPQNYSWAYLGDSSGIFIRDAVARDMQIAASGVGSHGFFYHLYINGQYWGLYQIDERPEGDFGATYFGGESSEYDAIKVAGQNHSIEATDGNFDAWFETWQLADTMLSASNSATANNAAYQRLLGNNPDGTRNEAYPTYIDPLNLIDEMLIVFWGGNRDAPISNFLGNAEPNNWFGVRNRFGRHGGWKFILHDSEHTLLPQFVNDSGPDGNRTGPWPAGNSSIQGSAAFSRSSPQYIFQQLMYSDEFKALFADRVYKHFYNNGVLTPTGALAILNARVAEIERAVYAESARWGDAQNPSNPLTPNHWLAAVNNVRNGFIPQRTSVVLGQLRGKGWYPNFDPPVFSQRGGSVETGTPVTVTLAPGTPGGSTIYYTTDGSDPRLFGGAINPNAASIASGGSIIIDVSKTIRVRTRSGTTWSAMDEVTFYVTQDYSGLAITEINYHPLPEGPISDDDFEFLEFKNVGTSTIDLGGLRFDSGITYAFPTGAQLAPGQFWIIARNPAQFMNRYPGVTPNGAFSGGLNNAGEELTIVNSSGNVILSLEYQDSTPWPAAADGNGFSAVPAGTVYNSSEGIHWRASANIHGSPGADDPPSTHPPIVVNEVMSNSPAPLRDTVELHNPTGSPVDISNWWLSDNPNSPQKYRIPAGTIIPPGGYVSFDESQFNVGPASFAFNSASDDVYLFSGDAAGNLTGYAHGFEFAGGEPGVSFGRYITSVGEEHFVRQTERTFGAVNSGPKVGPLVINEIMYNPYTGFDEYIEIRNISGATVELYDPLNPTNTWRLGGANYTFPQGASIPAGGYALVVGIDPTVFRNKYAIPGSVQIFGPYAGVLQDSGERLRLEMPGSPTEQGGVQVVPYIVIDSVRYNDKLPWPVLADGSGPSLQRIDSFAYADDPANWFADGATPGAPNSVNVTPTVSITSPTNNHSVTLPANITFQADASDSDGSVVKVEYYVDGGKVGEATTAPYTFVWTATGGIHVVEARAIDNGLAITVSDPITVLVNQPVSQGLRADYYSNQFLASPIAFTRIDPTVNFSDSTGWVGFGGVGTDNFSVRWSGQVLASVSGTYTFYTNSDDGVRLFVNDVPIISNWTDHGPTEDSGTINLTAGQLYTIVMEFYEAGGGATAQLMYSAPGLAKQIIPQGRLYPDSTPIIITHPANTTKEVGTLATFSVFASGINNQYQWRRNGVNIPGANSATLSLPEVMLSQAGTYSVVVSNSHGFAVSNNATLNVTFTDTDSDGIPNAWETLYSLNPNSAADADLDSDGDGLSNRDEYLAGTNPRDPNSVLTATVSPINGGFRVSFVAQSQRGYTVQYKNSLSDPTWSKLQDIEPQLGPRTVEVNDTNLGGSPSRFYRIVTPIQ